MAIINGNYREIVLDNGFSIVLQETPTRTISSVLRINHGGLHEKDGEEGLAHFLEHCIMSGGTEKYNPERLEEIRDCFGEVGASTGPGRTMYNASFLSEDFENYLDFISELVFSPRFDNERINGERQRVLREIADAKTSIAARDNYAFKNETYRGHPINHWVLGKEDVVGKSSINDLRKFHRRGYNVNNMDLAIVGGLPRNVEELVRNYFNYKSLGESGKIDFPLLQPLERSVILHRNAPDLYNGSNQDESMSHIGISLITVPDLHEDNYAVRMISYILGGDASSRLFKKIGLEKGLAYSVKSDCSGDYNAGVMSINASVPSKRQEEAVDAIFDEMRKFREEKIPERDVDRPKRIIRYRVGRMLESNGGHLYAINEKRDTGRKPEDFLNGYDAVTSQRINEVANKYLPTSREDGKYVLILRDPLKK